MFVMAQEDNTDVDIDTDLDGTPDYSTTLQRGENYWVNDGIKIGSEVTASAPVQVRLKRRGRERALCALKRACTLCTELFTITWFADLKGGIRSNCICGFQSGFT